MSEQVITAGESMKCPKCGGYLWPGVAGYAHQCPDAPTEMANLKAIKDKLDGLTAVSSKLVGLLAEDLGEVRNRLSKTNERLDAIAESQGKLLEAISGLRESGMRNHQQIMFHLRPKRKKGKR